MRKALLVLILCGLYIPCTLAQSNAESSGADPEASDGEPTLAELAEGADFIGILQVDTIEYETVREIPSEGFAILRVLVPYRYPGDVREIPGSVQVHEKGLDQDACYYPERRNEGQRYLAFLQKRAGETPEGENKEGFEGSRPGCMLPVFVTADNRYALRYPVPGVEVPQSSVQGLVFADPDAFIKPGNHLSYSRTDYMVEQGWLERADNDRYVYTKGIHVEDARKLMELDDRPEQENGG